jgi:hypothetical protein
MPVTDRDGGVAWSEVPAAVLAQHRTLRMLGEATREIARSTLRGDELGIAVLPYAVLGLERAIQTQYRQEAYSLREKHRQIIGEAAALSAGGAQDAVTVARRLHSLTNALLDDLREQEEQQGRRSDERPPGWEPGDGRSS